MNIKKVLSECKKIEDKIIEYRRELHKFPELEFQEKNTSDFIKKKLKDMGIEAKEGLLDIDDIENEYDEDKQNDVEDTSVLGIIKGEGKDNKGTVLLRADIDAVSIRETDDPEHIPNKEGFRSKNDGIMHACGHDGHMAMLLGAAHVLSKNKEEINGDIKLIFQPAEEGGKGAKLISKTGLLDDVSAVFGMHVKIDRRSGHFMINDGPMHSCIDKIKLEIIGGGGHAARPHETEDPLAISAEMITSLYNMQNREIDRREPAILTISKIKAGNAWNAIPDRVEMEGTIRTFDENIRKKILKRTKELGESLTSVHNLDFKFEDEKLGHPTLNTEREAEIAREAARDLFGKDKVTEGKPSMGGEDFAYYLQKVPGAYIHIGVRDEERGLIKPLHNPHFDLDESALYKGSALHVSTALKYLENL